MKYSKNPLGIKGICFVEFASPNPQYLVDLFKAFGFSTTDKHHEKNIYHMCQGNIHFFVHMTAQDAQSKNGEFVTQFTKLHGPSIPGMGWYMDDPKMAHSRALASGAKNLPQAAWSAIMPTIEGIGGSALHFIKKNNFQEILKAMGFKALARPEMVESLGFEEIDHLTNNVAQGDMQLWTDFYKNIFGFEEVRYFDIKGAKTGLVSYALKSPCGTFCIPINEGTEEKSQINEYLREYKGAGIQHLAFTTRNIVKSVSGLNAAKISTLDIDADYYREVFNRVPRVSEDKKVLEKLNILVDGDEKGYLLQIFTKNVIGPIFIEIIQRKNHHSFGEGYFSALFRSIERDQQKRGVL